ncbi:hypothetical protein CerSpe_165700 [Prunus speciosa]
MRFKSLVGDLNSSIHGMKPLIQDIEKLNNLLGQPKDELENLKEIMKEGDALVAKCSTISRWNAYKKYKYAKKLHDLDKRLNRQLTILDEEKVRDMKEILHILKHIAEKFEKLQSDTVTLLNLLEIRKVI